MPEVGKLQKEFRNDAKDVGTAAVKAVGALITKKVVDDTIPEITINDALEGAGNVIGQIDGALDNALENAVNG